jgi:hypothetical protein
LTFRARLLRSFELKQLIRVATRQDKYVFNYYSY